jgi:hypothetical protein
MSEQPVTMSGIDIMILRGPTLDDVYAALATACGLTKADIIGPDEDIMQRLDVLQRPLRAVILTLANGDCDFKVDIDGLTPRDFTALARSLAAALGHGVIIMAEDKPDPISAILLRPGAPNTHGYIEDAEPDGVWFHAVANQRGLHWTQS